MTCIVYGFKTKKALRETAESGGDVVIHDPSLFNPRVFNASDMNVGQVEVVTNHPKRSWFAQIIKTTDGVKVK